MSEDIAPFLQSNFNVRGGKLTKSNWKAAELGVYWTAETG